MLSNIKLPISAFVVGFDESDLLEKCLPSISFCEHILYIDLGSSDNSIEVAIENNAEVILHHRVPVVEMIHEKFYKKTKFKWLLLTDPDEIIDETLSAEIKDMFLSNKVDQTLGAIYVPCHFYFKKHKLKGTIWGGVNVRLLLAHNERFKFTSLVHNGRELLANFNSITIEDKGDNCVHHFWMQNSFQLIKKHKRYLKKEGESRFKSGYRTSLKKIFTEPLRAFNFCFFTKKGYRDQLIGLYLSVFWAWYQTSALIELYKYQKKS